MNAGGHPLAVLVERRLAGDGWAAGRLGEEVWRKSGMQVAASGCARGEEALQETQGRSLGPRVPQEGWRGKAALQDAYLWITIFKGPYKL